MFLVGIYVANIVSPPPPSARAVAVAGLLMWLFVPSELQSAAQNCSNCGPALPQQ